MKYFIIVFFLLTAIIPCQAQKVKPALHLIKGATYFMENAGTSAITQTVNGGQNKVNLSLSFKMAFKVTGIKDTIYYMDANYQALDMKVSMADTTIDMSSEKNDKLDIPSAIMAQMINKTFNITLSAGGKVLSVKNIDKLVNGVFAGFPQIDSAKKELVKKQFEQSFGENAFKSSLEMGTAVFPKAAVAKSDKWTVNTSLGSPTRLSVHTNYQLVDVTADFYQIHGDGTMETDQNSQPGEINGMPMKYDLNGSISNDIKVDKKTGWIIEVKMKQLLEGNIEISDNPKMPGGMSIPMIFNTEVTATGN